MNMAPYTDDSIELVSDHQKAAIELLSEGTHDELIRSRLAILDFIADKDAEIAALKAAAPQPAPVPAGWKLVPVEPTQDMLDAPTNAWTADAKITWLAMLASAPEFKAVQATKSTGFAADEQHMRLILGQDNSLR
jgi:hypothetical protein